VSSQHGRQGRSPTVRKECSPPLPKIPSLTSSRSVLISFSIDCLSSPTSVTRQVTRSMMSPSRVLTDIECNLGTAYLVNAPKTYQPTQSLRHQEQVGSMPLQAGMPARIRIVTHFSHNRRFDSGYSEKIGDTPSARDHFVDAKQSLSGKSSILFIFEIYSLDMIFTLHLPA
jgi:hypothetical protein